MTLSFWSIAMSNVTKVALITRKACPSEKLSTAKRVIRQKSGGISTKSHRIVTYDIETRSIFNRQSNKA